ncbi:MAG: hypothetical protein AAFQ43_10695, partial [Bacteroidota bacterium]
ARYPVANALGTLVPAIVLSVAGPVWTGKWIGVGLLASGALAAWALGRAVDERDAWARGAILVATLVVSSSFWNGYIGFQIGVTLALALGAVWVRTGPLAPWSLAVGSVVLFFAHAVPFAVCALFAGLDALRRRDGARLAALLPSAGLAIWYVSARLLAPEAGVSLFGGAGSIGRHLVHTAYTFTKLGPFQHPDRLNGSGILAGAPVAYWAAVGLSVAFVAVLAMALLRGTLSLPPGGQRRAALFGWAVLASSVLVPPFAFQVVNPGERVAVMGALILLATVPLAARFRFVLGVAALVFLVDDAASLAAQSRGLPSEAVEAAYADRAEREVSPESAAAYDVTSVPAPEAAPLFGHPVLLHSDRYLAAEREDWTRRTFETGLLLPEAD